MNILGHENISNRDLLIWIDLCGKTCTTEEEKVDFLDNLNLIDKLLSIEKTYSLLRSKKGRKQQLIAVIGNHIGLDESNLNSK
jgi:hypothetical protein